MARPLYFIELSNLIASTAFLQGNPTSKYQGVLHATKSILKEEGTRAFWSVIHIASTPRILLSHKWKCQDSVRVKTEYGIIHTEYDNERYSGTVASWLLPHHSQAFPLSSFWLLAVCKTGGGRPDPFYHLNLVSVYLGRQRGGGVPHQRNKLEVLSCSFCPKRLSLESSQSEKHTALGSQWIT